MSATPNPGGVNYTLTIVGQLWTTNAERNKHWSARATLTKQWRQDTFYAAKAAQIPNLGRAIITATPKQAKGRLADTGSHYGPVKACIDGLVDAGILDDDTGEHIPTVISHAAVRSTHKSMTGLLDELVLVIEPV